MPTPPKVDHRTYDDIVRQTQDLVTWSAWKGSEGSGLGPQLHPHPRLRQPL